MAEVSIQSVLSPDLILEILDCLAVPLPFHQRSCNLPVLAICSTVCKAWSAHAQRLLFRRVMIPHNIYSEPHRRATMQSSLPSFLAAIDPATERGRWLAESVLSFTLRHTGRELTADATGLATALLRMPNLRHLDVTTISCDFAPETFARLREYGPRITSLCILQDFSPFEAQHTRNMHHLVAAFPSIKLLEITSNLSPSLEPFDPPPRLALEAVKFNTTLVRDIGPCLASLLDLESEIERDDSEGRLQVLWHKSKGGHPSVLADVLSEHGGHLRSLAVRTLDADTASESLALCTRLERFEFGRFPDRATLALVPRTIRALTVCGPEGSVGNNGALIGNNAALDADGLAQQLSTFPQLKVLTWSSCPQPSMSSSPQPAMFPSLQWTCTKLGITLRLCASELVRLRSIFTSYPPRCFVVFLSPGTVLCFLLISLLRFRPISPTAR
ncbi:hypothetical protein C8R43DRAFT_1041950 [Mycena crocata]|nr:hypothetical protein C8R43DRAFT_1041950 [Mycena crocata]